jgi:tetratricopeptide (TPR) repeat protein
MIPERQYRRVKFLAGSALVLLSVMIVAIPLCHHLGYEFSLAIALVLPWIAGPATIAIHRRSTAAPPPQRTETEFRGAVAEALSLAYGLLLIPFAVATLSLFAFKNCSYAEGVVFFALLPGVTALWSVALASFCSAVTKRAFVLYAALTLLILLDAVYLGYTTPQIYAYNVIFGYFPGFSYDETLQITPTLILFRLISVVAALVLLALADGIMRARGKAAGIAAFRGFFEIMRRDIFSRTVLLAGLCILAGAWAFRTTLGIESSDSALRADLSEAILTEHFEIRLRPGSMSVGDKEYLAATHEFRFAQVESALELRHVGRIVSFIYPDPEAKRRWVGAATTNIAKPWRGEIHLTSDSWEGTLKHELVHVLAADFGMPVIRAHYNTGLVEGLATAVDGTFGNRTLHEYAALMIRFGIVADPGRLIRPVGFALQSSSVSYVAMGSFCRFLIDRYGIARMKALYGGAPVDSVYGQPYGRLIDEWRTLLDGVPVPASSRMHVEYFFRRPSIFAKECAHAIANLNEEGFRHLEHKDPVAADEFFRRSLRMSWNSEAFSGLIRSAYAAAQYDSVVTLMNTQLRDTTRRSGVIGLFLPYGDALWLRGDTVAAREAYEELQRLDLSDRLDESAALRRAVVGDSLLGGALKNFIVGSLDDAAALRLLDSLRLRTGNPAVTLLQGRLLLRLGRMKEGMDLLSAAEPWEPVLAQRKEQMLGDACFRLKEFAEARAHYARAAAASRNAATVAAIGEAIERCAWSARRTAAER